MKSHNKILFFLLLIPAYFMVIVLLANLVYGFGSIYWPMLTATLVLTCAGAWLLSRIQNLWLNTIGLLCFLLLGGYQALIHFIQTIPRTGPWMLDVYMGCGIILMGVAAYGYQIIKYKINTPIIP